MFQYVYRSIVYTIILFQVGYSADSPPLNHSSIPKGDCQQIWFGATIHNPEIVVESLDTSITYTNVALVGFCLACAYYNLPTQYHIPIADITFDSAIKVPVFLTILILLGVGAGYW